MKIPLFLTRFQTPFFPYMLRLCVGKGKKEEFILQTFFIKNVFWQATDFERLFNWKCELRNVNLDM